MPDSPTIEASKPKIVSYQVCVLAAVVWWIGLFFGWRYLNTTTAPEYLIVFWGAHFTVWLAVGFPTISFFFLGAPVGGFTVPYRGPLSDD